MRMVSLNRSRKFRSLFDITVRCKELPRLAAAADLSSSAQLRAIRRRAARGDEPSSVDSHTRMEHIAGIRTAIAEGRYHVSADDLAQKLIDHMLANRTPNG